MPITRHPNRLIARNISILPAVCFLMYLLPYTPVAVILFERLTNSYFLAMSVFSLMCLTTAVLEIPTGVISDKWGRRKSLMVGCFLCFVNVVFLALALDSAYSLWFLYGAALSQGTAQALYSGNNTALLYETLQSIKRSHQFAKIVGRMEAMTQAGLAISGIFGAVILLGGYAFDALIYMSLLTSVVLVTCSFFVIEPPRLRNTEDHSLRHIAIALKNLNKDKKLKLFSMINIFQTGTANASYFFTPSFIGSVWADWATPIYRTGQHIVGTISFWHAGHFVKKHGVLLALISTPFLVYGLWLAACWINNASSPFIVMLAPIFFSIWHTAKATFEQTSFSADQRATMGSIISLGSNIITAIICLIMGWLADHLPIHIALFIMLSISALIINGGYAVIYRKHKS